MPMKIITDEDRQREEQNDKERGGGTTLFRTPVPLLKVPEGQTQLRLIPAMWETATRPMFDFGVHWVDKRPYLCPDTFAPSSKICPVDKEGWAQWRELKAEGRLEDANEVRNRLVARQRSLAYVVVLEDMMLFEMSKSVSDRIYKLMFGPRGALGIEHPETGRDVIITRTGTGFNTRYEVMLDVEQSPVSSSPSLIKEMLALADANPLPDLFNRTTVEEIAAVYGLEVVRPTPSLPGEARPQPQPPAEPVKTTVPADPPADPEASKAAARTALDRAKAKTERSARANGGLKSRRMEADLARHKGVSFDDLKSADKDELLQIAEKADLDAYPEGWSTNRASACDADGTTRLSQAGA